MVFSPNTQNGLVKARYADATDILWLPASATAAGDVHAEAVIVHECVHAAVDLQRSTLTAGTSEVASYLVQTIFQNGRNFESTGGGLTRGERAVPGRHLAVARPLLLHPPA